MTNTKFIVGVPDSKLNKWLEGKEYMIATNEAEAVAIATGHYLATGERATVFMSADGFCNAMNPLTSLVIPYQIEINFVIGMRTDEPQHIVMGEKVAEILHLLEKGVLSYNYLLI